VPDHQIDTVRTHTEPKEDTATTYYITARNRKKRQKNRPHKKITLAARSPTTAPGRRISESDDAQKNNMFTSIKMIDQVVVEKTPANPAGPDT